MKKFKYGLFMELVYKFANIPVTLLFALHFFYIIIFAKELTYQHFPLLIYIIIVYLVNRHFYKTYKKFPYLIEANNEFLICKNFVVGSDIKINFEEVVTIEGSVFSNNPTKPLMITDKNENQVGIYASIKEFDQLLTIIMSNVKKELYEELVEKVKNPKSKK